jgi:hypothetical protein
MTNHSEINGVKHSPNLICFHNVDRGKGLNIYWCGLWQKSKTITYRKNEK